MQQAGAKQARLMLGNQPPPLGTTFLRFFQAKYPLDRRELASVQPNFSKSNYQCYEAYANFNDSYQGIYDPCIEETNLLMLVEAPM